MGRDGIARRLAAGLICLAAASVAEESMIEAEAAGVAARSALRSAGAGGDKAVAAWRELSVAGPRLVAEVTGAPSYWLVPLHSGAHAVGFVRVAADGAVLALGFTCRTPNAPELCPDPVFAMAPEAIRAQVGTVLQEGEVAGDPRLVHDGPPGREVWLTETTRASAAHRWIFTTPGGSYVREAGAAHGADPAVE